MLNMQGNGIHRGFSRSLTGHPEKRSRQADPTRRIGSSTATHRSSYQISRWRRRRCTTSEACISTGICLLHTKQPFPTHHLTFFSILMQGIPDLQIWKKEKQAAGSMELQGGGGDGHASLTTTCILFPHNVNVSKWWVIATCNTREKMVVEDYITVSFVIFVLNNSNKQSKWKLPNLFTL